MANYSIPEYPVYDEEIRKLEDEDPASSSLTFNPLVQKLINNTHAVKKLLDKTAPLSDTADPSTSTEGAIGQQYLNASSGVVWICVAAESGVYTWIPLCVVGVKTLTNNQRWPFNNSLASVAFAHQRNNLEYAVHCEVQQSVGGAVGSIGVSNKQLNGFDIAYDGSATSVTIWYCVTGGIYG